MKLTVIDLETSGLDPEKHEILEIGAIVFDDRDFKIYHTLEARIQPTHIDTAEPRALEVNGYNEADWVDAIPLKTALEHLALIASDSTMLAYNVSFDHSFLDKAYKDCDMATPFAYHRIDILSIAWAKIPHSKVQSWKLRTICSYLNITPESKVHRGGAGATKGFEVYKALMS